MELTDLKKLPLLQTATIAEAGKDEATFEAILGYLKRFFAGDYGEVCQEDTDANNADLQAGAGHILARYKQVGKLSGDIYIEAHFDSEEEGIDFNHIMIMYPDER